MRRLLVTAPAGTPHQPKAVNWLATPLFRFLRRFPPPLLV